MSRGGARSGAGRPAGSPNTNTAAARQALADRAGGHISVALAALADIAANGQSEAARVSAACAILDRCYGKPRQAPCSSRLHGLPDDPPGGLSLGGW